jgi:alpha-tubulin suppressor-like RCC1 family protein
MNYGQSKIPQDALTNVSAIAAGGYHSLALKSDGRIVAWGRNTDDKNIVINQVLGPNSYTGNDIIAIAAGRYTSFALKSDYTVIGWGLNINSYILANTISNATSSVSPVNIATNIKAISAGYAHLLALTTNNKIRQYGIISNSTIPKPTDAKLDETTYKAISAGGLISMAITVDDKPIGWGVNDFKQLTFPTTATNIIAIAAGRSSSLLIQSLIPINKTESFMNNSIREDMTKLTEGFSNNHTIKYILLIVLFIILLLLLLNNIKVINI